jgi:phosphoenolpyruvate phosphomutase
MTPTAPDKEETRMTDSPNLATGTKAQKLRALFDQGEVLRVIGVHDGFTALLAGRSFDALWVSGLGVSAAHGLADAGILGMGEFLQAARLADRASPLPTIADCDTGFGDVNNLVHLVREYEFAGIAAVCVEDKIYPKRNSFTPGQDLIDAHEFAAKIQVASRAKANPDFMLIARVEALIAGAGEDEAIRRAKLYVEAGADGIVFHSKSRTPDEVLSCVRRFRTTHPDVPVIVIPTTYPDVAVGQLREAGVSAVIYANQMLRAFVSAAETVLPAILQADSSIGVEAQLAPVSRVLSMIGTDEVAETDEACTVAAEKLRTR